MKNYFTSQYWQDYLGCKYTYEMIEACYQGNDKLRNYAKYLYGEACLESIEYLFDADSSSCKDSDEVEKYREEFEYLYPEKSTLDLADSIVPRDIEALYASEYIGMTEASYEMCLSRYELYRRVRRYVYDHHLENRHIVQLSNYKLGDAILDLCSELSNVVLGHGDYAPDEYLKDIKRKIQFYINSIRCSYNLKRELKDAGEDPSEYLNKLEDACNKEINKIHPLLIEYLEEYERLSAHYIDPSPEDLNIFLTIVMQEILLLK